jgi:hypothetical protein
MEMSHMTRNVTDKSRTFHAAHSLKEITQERYTTDYILLIIGYRHIETGLVFRSLLL